MKKLIQLVLAAILGSALTLAAFTLIQPNSKVYRIEYSADSPSVAARYTPDGPVDNLMDFSYTAEKVTPAVVHIKSTVTGEGRRSGRGEVPDLFRYFFDDENLGEPRPSVGTGSGVIISADGIIVTNNHVIENAEDIEVTLLDERSYKAKVIGTDPTTDLAVLQIDERDLPYLTFGNSDQLRVGQWVLAVGNPFNLNSTVTAGIVSAKGRNINILRERTAIESFIQTDAAVNPGNSGGALVDVNGKLVGINTAIASRTGSYAGYSFAVPARIVSKVVEDLLEYGSVQRGFLGVTIRSVNANMVREYDLKVNSGVFVDSLAANGAAEEAGILPGDVIVAVDGVNVKNAPALQELVGTKRPGDKVRIEVNRLGKTKEFLVTLKNFSGTTAVIEIPRHDVLSSLGAEFEALAPEEAQKFDLKGGVVVKKLFPGKIRQNTKMQEGFIITHVDNQRVESVEELTQIIQNKNGGVLIEGFYPNAPDESYYYALGVK